MRAPLSAAVRKRRRDARGRAVAASAGAPNRAAPSPQANALLPREVRRIALRELGPLVRELVLGEAGVDRAGLHARVAVDALLRVDVELLDLVVVGLVRGRMDAVDGADLDARVVLGADAGLCDDVGHGRGNLANGIGELTFRQ